MNNEAYEAPSRPNREEWAQMQAEQWEEATHRLAAQRGLMADLLYLAHLVASDVDVIVSKAEQVRRRVERIEGRIEALEEGGV